MSGAVSRDFWISVAQSYLDDCATRGTSVRASELASVLRLSPAKLATEFHATVGCCIKEHLLRQQVERARQLLRDPRRTTAEIAVTAGFGTARTFYRAFRGITGRSPTEYRKEMSLVEVEVRQ